jgi:hypothetical protein
MKKLLLITTLPRLLFGSWHLESSHAEMEKESARLQNGVTLYSDEGARVHCEELQYDEEGTLQLRGAPFVVVHFPHERGKIILKARKLAIDPEFKRPVIASGETVTELEERGVIHADRIEIFVDRQKRHLSLEQLVFIGAVDGELMERVHFNCERLSLKGEDQILAYLQENIELKIDELNISSVGPLELTYSSKEERLLEMVLAGQSDVSFERVGEAPVTLSYEGMATYDGEKEIFHIMSNPDYGKSLLLRHKLGEVRSDRATFAIESLTPLTLDHLRLEGSVYLNYSLDANPSLGLEPLQYATADQLIFSPKTREVSLSAFGGKRVLLYDNTNGVKMSAKQINMQYGDTIGEERIEGVGDVRFTFKDQEK